MNRRGFLAGILAAGMAPALVRAASLMKVVSPTGLVAPGPQVILGNPGMIVGDVFTIAGVDAVNPETQVDTGSLRNFVVTATANGSSERTTRSATASTSAPTRASRSPPIFWSASESRP